MKKRIIVSIISILLIFSLNACNLIETPDSKSSNNSSSITTKKLKFKGPEEKANAPIGIKVAIVPCQASLSGSIVPMNAIEEVGKRYKWKIQVFDGQGTPDKENKAIMNSVAWNANIIITISLDARSVQQGLQAAKNANIPIVSGSNGTDDPNKRLNLAKQGLLDFAYDVGPDYNGLGRAMAKWMKDHSKRSGKVVIYSCPGSYSVDYFEDGLLEGLKETNLKPDPNLQKFTFDQLGDELNRMVIGYLTKNPDTEFVFLPFDNAATGVVEALETAGYDKVKVCGVLGSEEMLSLIRQNTVASCTAAYDNEYLGYAVADQAIRLLNGQKLAAPRGENLPYQIVDKTCLPQKGKSWAPNMDYKSAYYKLWD